MTIHSKRSFSALLVVGDTRGAVAGQAAELVVQALERGRLEASAEQAQQAELRALRAEMSPHFVYNALTVITWIFVVGCVVTVPTGAVSLAHVPLGNISWRVWLAILYIIVLPTAGAYYLNGWALARVPPSTVAVYIYLQPLIAFVVAPIILGESLSVHTIIASLLIFAGVLVVTRRKSIEPGKDVRQDLEKV